jgi:hypothetical protein
MYVLWTLCVCIYAPTSVCVYVCTYICMKEKSMFVLVLCMCPHSCVCLSRVHSRVHHALSARHFHVHIHIHKRALTHTLLACIHRKSSFDSYIQTRANEREIPVYITFVCAHVYIKKQFLFPHTHADTQPRDAHPEICLFLAEAGASSSSSSSLS